MRSSNTETDSKAVFSALAKGALDKGGVVKYTKKITR